MKFSQNLMTLRRSKGMSQEELATKLNVTRQTISKWELEQTTPEMTKLIEMSRLFKISLDELVNNEELNYSNKKYNEGATKRNNIKLPIIILVAGLIISFIVFGIGLIKKNDAIGADEQSYNDAYISNEQKYKLALKRVNDIDVELEKLKTISGSNSATQVAKLETEKEALVNANYTFYYEKVDPITYKVFYYTAVGIFVVTIIIALIYLYAIRKRQ